MLAVAVAVALVAACSSPSEDDPTASPTTEAEDTDGAAAEEDDDGGEPDGDDGGEPDGDGADAEDPEPLGSATARLPASPNDSTLVPLRLDVLALERLDGMVELRVSLTNEGDRSAPEFAPYSSFDDPRLPTGEAIYSLSGAMLVDADDERAYLTIVDSEGTCLCTGRLSQVAVPPGESFEMYADFGGVPDDLEQVDVQVPGFPTVDAVPLD